MNIPELNDNDFVVVLTGAGVSAESGIKTFRDNNGLWENHKVEVVATPEGFKKNPKLVWRFYKERYFQSLEVNPNPGHYALVELEKKFQDNFLLITQNVDGLHSRAGSSRLIEMHGSLATCFCTGCDMKYNMSDVNLVDAIPVCLECGKDLRPDIVWFGEMPYDLDEIYDALSRVTVFLTIGTSGQVYPASYFVSLAHQYGAKTIGINLAKPENMYYIKHFYKGKSGEILPKLLKQWL